MADFIPAHQEQELLMGTRSQYIARSQTSDAHGLSGKAWLMDLYD